MKKQKNDRRNHEKKSAEIKEDEVVDTIVVDQTNDALNENTSENTENRECIHSPSEKVGDDQLSIIEYPNPKEIIQHVENKYANITDASILFESESNYPSNFPYISKSVNGYVIDKYGFATLNPYAGKN